MMHRIGAVMYLIWGVLHVNAALKVYQLGETLDPGMVQGRLFQGAWNLLFFAVVAMVVAAWLNRRNSRLGYWINLAAVTVTDIGFIVFILVPGYLSLWPGVLGPVFWVLGLVFATIGFLKGETTP
jgi:hypothetical protein